MNILFELNHPAHFHLFINQAKILKEKGHKIAFVIKAKDVLQDLVKSIEKDFIIYTRTTKEKNSSFIGNVLWLIESDFKMFKFCLKFKPDILLGSNFSVTHIGKLLRKPVILSVEDDAIQVLPLARIAFPFATCVMAPISCDNYKWEYKSVHFHSYHELAYLSPKYFKPDITRISKYIDITKPFFILRFSKLAAYHDVGNKGITKDMAIKIVEKLKQHGNIYITSEREIIPELSQYRISLPPIEMHHALCFATLFIGDSQTMAAEAAVLGTPALRFNDFVGKLGYLEELEHKYNLTYGIKTNEPDKLYQKIDELLSIKNLKEEWNSRKNSLLKEKIELADFMIWYIENFPESKDIINKNPEYQFKFNII